MKFTFNNIFLAALIGCIVILAYFQLKDSLFGEKPKPTVENFETTAIDTVEFRMRLEAELRAELKAKLKPELKIVYVKERTNIDSLQKAAVADALKSLGLEKEDEPLLGEYIFIAKNDTTLFAKDSLGQITDSISLHTEYISRIPLHNSGFFFQSLKHYSLTKTKHSNKTIVEKIPTKFGFGIQASGGYELTKGKFGLMIGVGVHYQLKTLLPFGWIEALGHGFHITGGFDPILEVYGVNIGYGLHLDIFGG